MEVNMGTISNTALTPLSLISADQRAEQRGVVQQVHIADVLTGI
jgi:hypothetical protein